MKIESGKRLHAAAILCLIAPVGFGSDAADGYLFDGTIGEIRRTGLPDLRVHWLEAPELRVTPELDEQQRWTQSYSLRMRPNSPGARRAVRSLFDTQSRRELVARELESNDVLTQRYDRLIELAAHEVALTLAQHRLALDSALLQSSRALTAERGFEPASLQATILDVAGRELDVVRAQRKAEYIRRESVGEFFALGAGAPLISTRLLAPAAMASRLADIDPREASLDLNEARLAVDEARHELAVQKHRNTFGLDLVELGFDDQRTSSYNMTVGFRLPFWRRQVGSAEGARDLAAAQWQMDLRSSAVDRAFSRAVRDVHINVRSYAAEASALQALELQMAALAQDASTIAAMRRHQLALYEAMARSHQRALHAYVDALSVAGHLITQAPHNVIRGI